MKSSFTLLISHSIREEKTEKKNRFLATMYRKGNATLLPEERERKKSVLP
jgi:hypothetical protein